MLVLKNKIPGLEAIKITVNTENVVLWINGHDIEERLEIFRKINIKPEKKEEAKKILVNICDELLNSELTNNELYILMTTFDSYARKVRQKIKKNQK